MPALALYLLALARLRNREGRTLRDRALAGGRARLRRLTRIDLLRFAAASVALLVLPRLRRYAARLPSISFWWRCSPSPEARGSLTSISTIRCPRPSWPRSFATTGTSWKATWRRRRTSASRRWRRWPGRLALQHPDAGGAPAGRTQLLRSPAFELRLLYSGEGCSFDGAVRRACAPHARQRLEPSRPRRRGVSSRVACAASCRRAAAGTRSTACSSSRRRPVGSSAPASPAGAVSMDR